MLEEWKKSFAISTFTGTMDVQEYGNYRVIKHSMKFWKMIIDNRTKSKALVNKNQFSFYLEINSGAIILYETSHKKV